MSSATIEPPPEPLHEAADGPGGDPNDHHRRWLRLAGMAVGFALLIAAIAYVIAQRDIVAGAFAAIRTANPWSIVLLAATVLINLSLTATLLRLLMSRFGRVGAVEMHALIAAASLFNYLPMRPGLVGRLGYHKKYNGIRVRDSVRVMIEAIGLGAGCAAWIVAAILISKVLGQTSLWIALSVPVAALPALGVNKAWRVWVLAALCRYLDLIVTALRYFVTFALIDHAITVETAGVLASVGLATTLVPFLSNGLGLREWSVGLLTPLLESSDAFEPAIAVAGDLVNRSAEIVVVAITGLVAALWIAQRLRRSP